MDALDRENVRAVLARFGVLAAQRAPETDPTEEVILVDSADFARIDAAEVTAAIMDVLPSTKVWVVEVSDLWDTEPL